MRDIQRYIVLILVPLAVDSLSLSPILDPCGEWLKTRSCPADEECRLVQVQCFRAPCPPQPTCVPKAPRVSSCRYGDPVLGADNVALWCSDTRLCPDNTTCNYEVQDVSTTCCWQPHDISPAPPPYDPCIATTCLVGHTCEARIPETCFNPPCQAEGVCIPPTGTTPPTPQNGCETIVCSKGYHCELLAGPCALSDTPRPCPLVPVCLKDPVIATDKPGFCPATSGVGICLHSCETDGDCEGNQKCCSNGCGSVCSDPLREPPTTTGTPPSAVYPCATVRCGAGQECRLKEVQCRQDYCPPQATCVPVIPKPLEPRCPVGYPVLNTDGEEIFCGLGPSSRTCPDNTFCKTHPADQYAVCCHQPKSPPLENPCALIDCAPGFTCQVKVYPCLVAPCPLSGECVPDTPISPCAVIDCASGYTCKEVVDPCLVAPCPTRGECVPNKKSGECPSLPFDASCRKDCFDDVDCVGRQKCCKNGCGKLCVDPVVTPTPSDPCSGKRCDRGFECRLKEVNCVRAPCNPQPTCVPEIPKASERQCPVGFPVVDMNNQEFFCGRGFNRRDCPSNTYCNIDPVDRFAVCCYRMDGPVTILPPPPTTPKPVVKEGTCPSTTGLIGTCVERCSGDDSCPGTQKCCSNGCGHTCQEPTGIIPLPASDPCSRMRCDRGFECRLKEVNCVRAPCNPQPTCVPEIPKASERQCPVGYPVVDMNNQEFFCGRGFNRRDCPSNTYCNIDPVDRFAVCCYRTAGPVTILPPPPTTPKPVVKEGNCPNNIGLVGICVDLCSGDANCPGTQKCCGNGCGRTCQEPTTYAASDPCSRKKCRRNRVCQLQRVTCARPPCPPVGRCVAKSSVAGSKRCKSGYPVLNFRRRAISCRTSRSCPHNTLCSDGVCCWNTDTPTRPTRPPVQATPPLTKNTCPKRFSFHFYILCKYFYTACSDDSQCVVGTVCCNGGRICGGRCVPATEED